MHPLHSRPTMPGASLAPAFDGLIPRAARDHVLQIVQAQLQDNEGQRLTPALIVGVMTLAQHLIPVAPTPDPTATTKTEGAPKNPH